MASNLEAQVLDLLKTNRGVNYRTDDIADELATTWWKIKPVLRELENIGAIFTLCGSWHYREPDNSELTPSLTSEFQEI